MVAARRMVSTKKKRAKRGAVAKASAKRGKAPKDATEEPTKVLMSMREYARFRGVSHTAVQKAVKEGRIRIRKDGRINRKKADAEWKENTLAPPAQKEEKPKSQTATPGPDRFADEEDLDDEGTTFSQARTAKELYLARLRKLEFEEKSGKLVDANAVRRAQFSLLRTIRDQLLELPDRLADELAAEDDPMEVRDLFMAELRSILSELADDLAGRGEESGQAEAA